MRIPVLKVVSQPLDEPVSLAEMKVHLRQDEITRDDALIATHITTARDIVETLTGRNVDRSRTMIATTFNWIMDAFPSGGWYAFPARGWYIRLPRLPLVSVVGITYIDGDGNTQTLSTSVYTVDYDNGEIYLGYNQYWPVTRLVPNAVTVQFIAGIAATFTADASTDRLTIVGRTFAAGDRVRLLNSGTSLPSGLTAKTEYFVVNPSGSTCQLSLTAGGSVVDITDGAKGGINFITADYTTFETLRNAIKILCGHIYRNPDADPATAAEGYPDIVNWLAGSAQAS